MRDVDGVVGDHQKEGSLAGVFAKKINRPRREGVDALGVIRGQRATAFEVNVVTMKISIGCASVELIVRVVADRLHLLLAHSLAEVGRDVILVRGLEDVRQGCFLRPTQAALDGEDVVYEGVAEPGRSFAELDAFAGRRAGRGGGVAIGKTHPSRRQLLKVRSAVEVAS